MDKRLDLTGFLLDEAIERCRAMGLNVNVSVIGPVQDNSSERLRVVRYKIESGKGELTAVFEYTKKGGSKRHGL